MLQKDSSVLNYEGRLKKQPDGSWLFQYLDLPMVFGVGPTQSEAIVSAQARACKWIAEAQSVGTKLPSPGISAKYSGNFRLRLPRSLGRNVDALARNLGRSRADVVRQMIEYALEKLHAGDQDTLAAVRRAEQQCFVQCPVGVLHKKGTLKVRATKTASSTNDWFMRFDSTTHYQIMALAEMEGVSANTMLVTLLSMQFGSWESSLIGQMNAIGESDRMVA